MLTPKRKDRGRDPTCDLSKAARMCPACKADSIVSDTRERPDGTIMRRRTCSVCGTKFVTTERLIKVYG